ncbi:gliding-associated putative ABC transporter substrate-binding component GldG [Saccharicrinis fermentans DSM 9555 = JCM 21142]|uniref:Gliding-associated putative ABC transporter substrate-binding component GldG n=2 Tax=Saccharicrinis fermentans TaxID=982 RepID=W7YN74_9BACT|nr:gliding-associated putative ABC transporter substrate-binding component GldG [Saccharicrinis fermentans DSM 9555 = JCM 21142]
MSTSDIKSKNIWQLVVLLVAIVVVNMLAGSWFFRLDLTSEKRYSLSENTKNLVADLDQTIFVKVFLEGDLNVGFSKLSKASYELLNEFRVYGGNHIEFRFIDPSEGNKKEKEAVLKELKELGLNPVPVYEQSEDGRNTTSYFYPYAVVYYGDKQLPLNLLENIQGFSGAENLNKSIESLEFKFTDAIRRVSLDEKPKIAFIEGHGELDDYDVMDITEHLSQYYQVDRGVIGNDPSILDPYKAIIIAKPQNKFSESDKFVIDQYMMNGGGVMWLVDAVNITLDSLKKARETIGMMADLNIEDQLFKYGIRINPVLIQDMQSAMIPMSVSTGGQPRIVPAPWLYSPLLIPQPDHAISRNMNVVQGEFVSSLDTVNSQLDIKRKVLLRTSRYAKSDQVPVFVSLAFVNEKPDQRAFRQPFMPVAIVQEGVFTSVFEHREPPHNISPQPDEVKSKSVPTKMIVVGDGDLIKNKVRFKNTNPKILPLGYDELTKQNFGNKDFILNAVNYLCDDDGWMDLRARSYTLRLLDKKKVAEDAFFWKLINVILPVVLVLVLGVVVAVVRRYKFMR